MPENDIAYARTAYIVAYLRGLPAELRDVVDHILKATDNLRAPSVANQTEFADLPREVLGEALRVILYLNDVHLGVYADEDMPTEGHNATAYLTGGEN